MIVRNYQAGLVISKYIADKENLNFKEFKTDIDKIRGGKEGLEILSIQDVSAVAV